MDSLRGNPTDFPGATQDRFSVTKRVAKFLEVSSFERDSNGSVLLVLKGLMLANVHSRIEQLANLGNCLHLCLQ